MSIKDKNISVPFHWSAGVFGVTILVVMVLSLTGLFLKSISWPTRLLWLEYLLYVVFAATVVVGLGYMPRILEANDKTVKLKRLFGPLRIPLSDIVEAKQISKLTIEDSRKTFGSDGFFGYLGRFKNQILGNYTMYATDLKNLILIRTDKGNYVFSCSRSREFVEFINSLKGV
jgi:hypothetical protein